MKKLKATISEGKIKVNKKDLEKETFNLRKSTLGQLDEMIGDWEVTRSEAIDFIISTFYDLYQGNLEIDVERYDQYSKDLAKSEKKAKKEAKKESRRKRRKRRMADLTLEDYWNTGTKEELVEMELLDLRFIARELGITCSLRDREALIEMIWEKALESYKKNEIKSNSNVYNFMDYERKNKK